MGGNEQELIALQLSVENEIGNYVYRTDDGLIGTGWKPDRLQDGLERMRAALAHPYWIEIAIRDTYELVEMTHPPKRACAAVADDGKGTLL